MSPSLLQQASAADSSAAVAWRFNATTRDANRDKNPFQRVSLPHGFSPRDSRRMKERGLHPPHVGFAGHGDPAYNHEVSPLKRADGWASYPLSWR